MSIEWITIGLAIIGNIVAWAYTYGKLNQKVINLADILDNGLCEKVSELSREVAYLKGIIEGLAKQLNDKLLLY